MNATDRRSWLELRVPPAVLFLLCAALMWTVSRWAPLTPLDDGPRRIACWTLALLGAGLITTGVITFRRARTTVHPSRPEEATALVSGGIYRFTRNPMYLGMLVLLLGWAVFLHSAWSLPVIAAFVAWMNRYQISAEERALQSQFGAAYETYKRQVRRWL
jgi:protein-S-isoprenylcysteine O-methyltransferase Ste14